MEQGQEHLGRRARVRADILHAHLAWAAKRWSDVAGALGPHLDAPTLELVTQPPSGDKASLLFSDLVRIDRALAAAAGGDAARVFHALGVHSAQQNLSRLHADYDPERPHEFFASMSLLHRVFQDFGKSRYERLGERSGRIRIERYREYSPVFCQSGRGYYEEALRIMKVPGPVSVDEVECRCAGYAACVFELAW